MNHHALMDLVFKDTQDLSAHEASLLRDHLQDCEVCRSSGDSLQSLTETLHSIELLSPEPGFSSRWEIRLQKVRQRAHQKQTLLISILFSMGLLLLGIFLIRFIWPLMQSPDLLVWTWIYRLIGLYSYLVAMRDIVSSTLSFSSFPIPLIVWIFALGLLSELAVLWVVSYRILTKQKKVVG